MAASHLGRGKPEDLLAGGIAGFDLAVIVDRQDAFGHVVEHGAEVRLAFAERFFGDGPLGDFVRELLVERFERLDRVAALA